MNITVSIFIMGTIITVSLMAGFWIGRSLRWKMAEGEEDPKEAAGPENFSMRRLYDKDTASQRSAEWENESGTEKAEKEEEVQEERRHKHGEKVIPKGRAIGSPCSGEVSFFYEGSRRGAVIQAEQGLVYAPAAGKIIRLYPMGNAFLLRTEFGVELLIKVGSRRDELLSMYYRPRIVQNEIVNKGKLLLEYDLEGLQAEGADTEVSISVEAAEDYRDILITGQKYVRAGEEVLWVREKQL